MYRIEVAGDAVGIVYRYAESAETRTVGLGDEDDELGRDGGSRLHDRPMRYSRSKHLGGWWA